MHKHKNSLKNFTLRPACLALVLALTPAVAWSLDPSALPSGATIEAGSGSIVVNGNRMVIDQATQKLIANWHSFDIGSGASVHFSQPNASSAALNRVTGGNASQIFGALSSNGQVFLVNPSGILFAPGAQVDTGGLVASTLGIDNADFLAGRYQFEGAGGSVVNQGQLRAGPSGRVALVGAKIVNEGGIAAPGGAVALAAGEKVRLDFEGDGLISVDVDRGAFQASILNRGQVVADGGVVVMRAEARDSLYSTVVNNSGTVRARSVGMRNGVVVLDGGSQGVVDHSGSIDVSGTQAGQKGGRASVLGDKVAITGSVDARGAKGGGVVLVGGGFQGKGSERNASAAFVSSSADIKADSLEQGDGGTVVVWSDGGTRFYGNISARGGRLGGSGGMVETSGKEWLDVLGAVDASAVNGAAGTWLLDPQNVTISNDPTYRGDFDGENRFVPTGNNSIVNVGNINDSLNAGTSVVITTGTTGAQGGDITVDSGADIHKSAGGEATFTLQAYRHIIMNGTIRSSNDKLNVILNSRAGADSDGGDGRRGYVDLTGGTINSNGGSIVIGGGSDPTIGYAVGAVSGITNGVRFGETTLSSGAGNITVNGQGGTSAASGVNIANSSTNLIETDEGNIVLRGKSATGHGILIQSSNHTLRTGSGNIELYGETGGSSGGVRIGSGATTALFETDSGTIVLHGKALSDAGTGVWIDGGNLSFATGKAGGIRVQGQSDGQAVLINGAEFQAGAGGIEITGQGTSPGAPDTGYVNIKGATVLDTTGGDITVRSTSHIAFDSSNLILVDTQGGDIVLNSRSQNGATGYIDLRGASLLSGGGNIVAGGGSDPTIGYAIGAASGITNGVRFGETTLSAGAGNITVNGQGGTSAASGVNLANSSTNLIEANEGSIVLRGKSATGHGILIQSSNHTLRTGSGNIELYGETGGSSGGVRIGSGATTASFETDSGIIALHGKALSGAGTGVWIDGGNLSFATGQSGGIRVQGQGDGQAVLINGAALQAGAGGIEVVGQGVSPGSSDTGYVNLRGATTLDTAGGDFIVRSTSHIAFDSSNPISVNTQGGDITLNSRSQNGETGYIDLRNTSLISGGGNIVAGGGSDPAAGYAIGPINGVRFGGSVLSAGKGNIIVNSEGGSSHGISLANSSTNVFETTSGDITLRGIGDGSSSGVLIQSGNHTIQSGTGNIAIEGEAKGSGTGVRIGTTATTDIAIATQGGSITIKGRNTGSGDGAYVGAGKVRLEAKGQGTISVDGEAVQGVGVLLGSASSTESTTLRTEAGRIHLKGVSQDGSAVRVRGADMRTGTGGFLIEGGQLVPNGAGGGDIRFDGAMAMQTGGGDFIARSASHISFDSSNPITVNTRGGDIILNSRSQNGATGYIDLRGATLISGGGDIVAGGGSDPVTGYAIGAGSGVTNGVRFGDTTLSADSGNISVSGQGGTSAASGISMANNSVNAIETTSGNITLRGSSQGGAGDEGSGIIMQTGNHTVSSQTGNIRVEGQAAGSGTGVRIGSTGNSTVMIGTQGGTIAVSGRNAGSGDAVYIGAGDVNVAARGQGSLSVTGQAVEGNAVTIGPIGSSDTTTLSTEDGDIHLTGASQDGYGVNIYASASSGDETGRGRSQVMSRSGDIVIDGRSVAGIGVRNSPISTGDTYIGTERGDIHITGRSEQDLGIEIYPSLSTSTGKEGSATIAVGQAGNISLHADSMSLAGPRTLINGGGTLTIAPITPGKRVGFGSGTYGDLMLTNFQLGAIGEDWSRIVVGNPTAGWVEIAETLPENIKVRPIAVQQVDEPPTPDAAEARMAVAAAELLVGEGALSDDWTTPTAQLRKDDQTLPGKEQVSAASPGPRQAEIAEDQDDDDDEEEDGGE